VGQTLEYVAFAVMAITALFIVATLSQPVMRQQVQVMRLRRNMRKIEVVVVDWKRDLGGRR
jgi:hypothetical protein